MPRTPEQRCEAERTRRALLRTQVLTAYGSACECCGESIERFLTIDHVNDDGAAHRKNIGGSPHLYRWLRDRGFPSGFRVLCTSCNTGRYINGGICPHQGPVKSPGNKTQAYRRRLKYSVLDGYGGKCTCCAETEKTFLTIDHVEGNGGEHRRELGPQYGPIRMYRLLRDMKHPPGFRVMCFNCNDARQFNGGVCPHAFLAPAASAEATDGATEPTGAATGP